MRLKCKQRTKFWRKRRLQQRMQSRVMANFAKALKAAFSEIWHRGDQGKIAQKVGRQKGIEKHPGANLTIY